MSLLDKLVELINPLRPRWARNYIPSSKAYWESRYLRGGDSGIGSEGRDLEYKANYINSVIREFGIESFLELGPGNGNLASRLEVSRYLGLDASATAVKLAKKRYPNVDFRSLEAADLRTSELFDMCGSFDVIYHLVEDQVFGEHLDSLFSRASKVVLVYSSNFNDFGASHVRHRNFSEEIQKKYPSWRLAREEAGNPTGSFARFFVYERL
jgi:SAM-dependent methyltransferase